MEPKPADVPYHQKTERWLEILVGAGLLVLAGGFSWFGGIGLWNYLHGSTAAPASPIGWGIALPAATWLILISRRLIFGRDRERRLISDGWLLTGAILAFTLAAVMVPIFLIFGGGIRAMYGAPIFVLIGYSALSFRKQRRERSPE